MMTLYEALFVDDSGCFRCKASALPVTVIKPQDNQASLAIGEG